MRLTLFRRLVVLVTVALLVAGCQQEGDGGEAGGTGGSAQLPVPGHTSATLEPVPSSPAYRLVPPEDPCPDTYPEHVPLVGTDVRATVNLMGVTACSNGAGRLWLKNGALVPWVIKQPVLRPPPPQSDDPQTVLFREALSGLTASGLIIEPGQEWYFSGEPVTLLLQVDSGASATWQVLTAAKSVAESKVQDGLAGIVSGRSPGRGAVVECARAAWDAGKAAESGSQQLAQTPSVYVLETIGLGQQIGACGAALQQLERTQPPQQVLVTADDLAGQLRRPQVAGVIDESVSWLPKLCASLPRC